MSREPSPYLQELISVLQSGLVGDAAGGHLGDEHAPALTTHDGDAQWLRPLLYHHVARVFQVRPSGSAQGETSERESHKEGKKERVTWEIGLVS